MSPRDANVKRLVKIYKDSKRHTAEFQLRAEKLTPEVENLAREIEAMRGKVTGNVVISLDKTGAMKVQKTISVLRYRVPKNDSGPLAN